MHRTLLLVAAAVAASGPPVAAAKDAPPMHDALTSIRTATRTLPAAPLGGPNRWPIFRLQLPAQPIAVSDDLSAEDRAGMFRNARVPPLPYLMQDQYTRQRRPTPVATVVLENGALRATCYPQLGGRLASLWDKRAGRELLFDNPALQFANLAIRNAWFSGGVEWNGPLYGHSLLTCSPVFAATVQTERGPLLRLYEFDRALETVWQVDLLLPPGDDRLWVHVKATNPNPHEVPFYWWTNIALPLTPQARVLTPADYALEHVPAGNSRASFPHFAGGDGSYPIRYTTAMSLFFRKPGTATPWLVTVQGDGRGLAHVSTATLFGRKLFTWGTGRGGRRWMDYLSEEGKGDYIEVQGGVTPTQLQTRPLAAGASIEWTECLAAIEVDARAAHQPDYAAASAVAAEAVGRRVGAEELRRVDAFLAAVADSPVAAVLCRGAAWGLLHERRTGKRLSPGLSFQTTVGDEERPWAELLDAGRFSEQSLAEPPQSFNISPGWVEVLRRAAATGGETWLGRLHLGVAALEGLDTAAAGEHFRASLALTPSALAHRCLALCAERAGDVDQAQRRYEQAWALAGEDAPLAVERAEFLLRHRRHAALAAFVAALPAAVAGHERLVLVRAKLALHAGDYAGARRAIDREFTTIREGDVGLTELWFDSYIAEAQRAAGRPLSDAEAAAVRQQHPPPRVIDFRMR